MIRPILTLCLITVLSSSALSCRTPPKADLTQSTPNAGTQDTKRRVDNDYCAAAKNNPPTNDVVPGPNVYIIFSVYLKDPIKYLKYFDQAFPLVYKNQGRMVMRGVKIFDVLEGSAPFQAFNIVEFPNAKAFTDFYCSEDYQPDLRQLRLDATKNNYAVLKTGDLSSTGINSSSTKDDKKGLILFNDSISDSALYAEYLDEATKLAAQYGGRRLLSGTNHRELEGYESDKPYNLTLFSFPSSAKQRDWYRSDAYQKLKAKRVKASKVTSVIAMDGFVP